MTSVRHQIVALGSSQVSAEEAVIKSPAFTVLGYSMTAGMCLVTAVLLILRNDAPLSWLDSWLMLSFMIMPVGLLGWLIARYTRFGVGAGGVLVINPYNEAYVAWEAIEEFDENPSGLLRIRTAEWKISSWAVEVSNWERWLSRPSRVELLTSFLATRRDRFVDSGCRGPKRSWKRWRLPYRPLIPYGIIWIVLTAVLSQQR